MSGFVVRGHRERGREVLCTACGDMALRWCWHHETLPARFALRKM